MVARELARSELAGEPIRVLVVDDVPDIRRLVRLALTRAGGFDVVGEAGDGAVAIVEASRLRPDIVLLDLSMPVMDGLEALPNILASAPGSKVLVLSGFTSTEMSAEAIRRGASDYMEKGNIATKLAPRLRDIVGKRSQGAPAATATRAASPVDQQAQEELVAMLVHELASPVTVIQGFAEMLSSADHIEQALVRDAADAITRGAKHLANLVTSFTDLRKLEVDALDLVLLPTDVVALVRDCVSDMVDGIDHEPVVHAPDHLVVRLDPTRVRQVLINLLSNAAKFSPMGTPIEVTVSVKGDSFEIAVRDYGPGIPALKHAALFEKFGRLNAKVHGTGLGLYISRGIAQAHGGDLVLADGNSPGCTFALRLPLEPTVTGMNPTNDSVVIAHPQVGKGRNGSGAPSPTSSIRASLSSRRRGNLLSRQ